MDISIGNVVIDCENPRALAEFWGAVTGYERANESDEWVGLKDPSGRRVSIGLQRVPEPKAGKNRVHIDLFAADEEAAAKQIEALGARRLWVSKDPNDVFIVLADPEGNEFCVVRDG